MCKVTFLLHQLLIFLNLFIVYLFTQRDCQKSFYPRAALDYFFISPGWWIGNEQLFKVGLTYAFQSESTLCHISQFSQMVDCSFMN